MYATRRPVACPTLVQYVIGMGDFGLAYSILFTMHRYLSTEQPGTHELVLM